MQTVLIPVSRVQRTFKVYFPDGTLNSENGGQQDTQRFQKLFNAAKMNGYDIQFQSDVAKESVVDYKDNTFVNAYLLQFPYG